VDSSRLPKCFAKYDVEIDSKTNNILQKFFKNIITTHKTGFLPKLESGQELNNQTYIGKIQYDKTDLEQIWSQYDNRPSTESSVKLLNSLYFIESDSKYKINDFIEINTSKISSNNKITFIIPTEDSNGNIQNKQVECNANTIFEGVYKFFESNNISYGKSDDQNQQCGAKFINELISTYNYKDFNLLIANYMSVNPDKNIEGSFNYNSKNIHYLYIIDKELCFLYYQNKLSEDYNFYILHLKKINDNQYKLFTFNKTLVNSYYQDSVKTLFKILAEKITEHIRKNRSIIIDEYCKAKNIPQISELSQLSDDNKEVLKFLLRKIKILPDNFFHIHVTKYGKNKIMLTLHVKLEITDTNNKRFKYNYIDKKQKINSLYRYALDAALSHIERFVHSFYFLFSLENQIPHKLYTPTFDLTSLTNKSCYPNTFFETDKTIGISEKIFGKMIAEINHISDYGVIITAYNTICSDKSKYCLNKNYYYVKDNETPSNYCGYGSIKTKYSNCLFIDNIKADDKYFDCKLKLNEIIDKFMDEVKTNLSLSNITKLVLEDNSFIQGIDKDNKINNITDWTNAKFTWDLIYLYTDQDNPSIYCKTNVGFTHYIIDETSGAKESEKKWIFQKIKECASEAKNGDSYDMLTNANNIQRKLNTKENIIETPEYDEFMSKYDEFQQKLFEALYYKFDAYDDAVYEQFKTECKYYSTKGEDTFYKLFSVPQNRYHNFVATINLNILSKDVIRQLI